MGEEMMDRFIGAGWAFPLRVGPTGGIALVRREQELEQAMRLILATYPGERPMRPAFGSRLRDFVFQTADAQTAAELAHEVRQSLQRWEPRVEVAAVEVTPDPDDPTVLYLDIQYLPKGANDPRNLVFPFYTIPDDGTDY
ncbi:GPW/gp25 family protein [Crossiella cryophila]|uniref:Phage baseplate assembly protein W n=1 Tax=Crossiella cryophila TaxID=43355 RepID=A0A7W7CF03_9PSEU|nr:GPW/gp25 family protein [Crossiella cryophila]MBB4680007.1 phage baseplate assembly protein W [Crossiella cryophila]